ERVSSHHSGRGAAVRLPLTPFGDGDGATPWFSRLPFHPFQTMEKEVEPVQGALEFVVNQKKWRLTFPVSTQGCTMNFIGIDLHKKTITIEALNQERRVVHRQRLACCDPNKIVRVFESLRPFQAVMEATASYEWLWNLLEPLAERLLLANPHKLRVI